MSLIQLTDKKDFVERKKEEKKNTYRTTAFSSAKQETATKLKRARLCFLFISQFFK